MYSFEVVTSSTKGWAEKVNQKISTIFVLFVFEPTSGPDGADRRLWRNSEWKKEKDSESDSCVAESWMFGTSWQGSLRDTDTHTHCLNLSATRPQHDRREWSLSGRRLTNEFKCVEMLRTHRDEGHGKKKKKKRGRRCRDSFLHARNKAFYTPSFAFPPTQLAVTAKTLRQVPLLQGQN